MHILDNGDLEACRIWKLIPETLYTVDPAQQVDSVPPPRDGNPGNQRCACTHQTTETNNKDDECDTTVVETRRSVNVARKWFRGFLSLFHK